MMRSVAAVLLSFLSLSSGCLVIGISNPAQAGVHISYASIGDRVVYDLPPGPHATERATLTIEIDAMPATRDPFDRAREAALSTFHLEEVSGFNWTRRGAVSEGVGTIIWHEDLTDASEGGETFTWADRSYRTYGEPTFWGSSVLSGRTLAPGMAWTLNLPAENRTIGFEVHAADQPRQVWVELVRHGKSPEPWEVFYSPFNKTRLLMEDGTPYPVEVYGEGERVATMLETVMAGGGQAWSPDEEPTVPWKRAPQMMLLPADPRGLPPSQGEDARPYDVRIATAYAFAEREAPGLRAFLDEHPDAWVAVASVDLFSAGLTASPMEPISVRAGQPDEAWTFSLQAGDGASGHTVEVGLNTLDVGQHRVHEELEIRRDQAGAEPPLAVEPPFVRSAADLSQFATELPSELANHSLIGVIAYRHDAAHPLFDRAGWVYAGTWSPPCNGACGIRSRVVSVDAGSGMLLGASGPVDFVSAYDEVGLWEEG